MSIKMVSATLALDGYSKSDNLSVIVCHVHFCGLREPNASKITSFWLPPNDGTKGKANVKFTVPSLATAVCVTLVWRYKGGWQRHGRCRFSTLLSPKSVPHSALQLSKASNDSTKASDFPWNLEETKHVLFESTLMPNGTATRQMASYDVASNIRQAQPTHVRSPRHRAHLEPSFLESNTIP